MSNQIVATLVLSMAIASCSPAAPTEAPSPVATLTPPSAPTATEGPAACLESFTPVPVNTADFKEPEPGAWVMLMKPVREYLYYRKKAVVAGDIKVLWDRYPALERDGDPAAGINAESLLVEGMEGLKPFDGNVFPETYERIKAFVTDGQAAVLVHGMELYLYLDDGQFEDSGGEFKIVLYLCPTSDRPWTVYKTDEVTQAEWNQQSP